MFLQLRGVLLQNTFYERSPKSQSGRMPSSRNLVRSKISDQSKSAILETHFMDFFNSAVDCLETLVCALGAGLGIWGAINLLEGYGNDNPGSKSQGMKQLLA